VKKLILFSLICLCSTMAFTQTEGELPINDSLYNAIEESNNLDVFGGVNGEKGIKNIISLKRLCPPQNPSKTTNSDMGWTVAVAQTMSMQYKDLNSEQQLFSYQFIYDALPKVSNKQCSFSKNWMVETKTLLETKGMLTIQEYSFTASDCNRKPDSKLITKAKRNCVRSFNRVFDVKPTDGSISLGGKIESIQKCLDRNHPVILCIVADEQFRNLKSSTWNPTVQSTSSLQTVVVVGLDEKNKVIEVMGNYSSWGKSGFAYIRYQDIIYAKYAFEIVMTPQPTPQTELATNTPTQSRINTTKPPIPQKTNQSDRKINKPEPIVENNQITLSGELIVNKVIDMNKFQKVEINRKNVGFYEMTEDCKLKDQFQLISQKSQTGSFVYVFSVDPNGKAEVHYPIIKTDEYGMSVTKISPVVPSENSQVVIPEPRFETNTDGNRKRIEQALSKTVAGADWLVVLHSDRRIDEIDDLVAQLNHHNRDFMPTFKRTFGDRLIDKYYVSYNGSSFRANTNKGYIVPMIIKIEAN
jgi:hypothetical protein